MDIEHKTRISQKNHWVGVFIWIFDCNLLIHLCVKNEHTEDNFNHNFISSSFLALFFSKMNYTIYIDPLYNIICIISTPSVFLFIMFWGLHTKKCALET
ncbi:hypothetical protein ACJX0J_010929, partial [Zea mays]